MNDGKGRPTMSDGDTWWFQRAMAAKDDEIERLEAKYAALVAAVRIGRKLREQDDEIEQLQERAEEAESRWKKGIAARMDMRAKYDALAKAVREYQSACLSHRLLHAQPTNARAAMFALLDKKGADDE